MTTNTLGSDPAFRPKPATSWLLPFVPMGFAAFSLSALVFFHLRQDAFEVRSALQHVYAALYRAIGFAPAVMFFGLVILWSTIWLANGALRRPLSRLGRLAAMTVMLGVLLNLGDGGVSPALHKGAIGAAVASALVSAVGYWPSLVLVWAMTFASLLLATDFFFQESFERMLAPARDAAEDVGVETVAADRLREERAAATPPPAAIEAMAANVAATESDEASWRRRSWHERRAEREAMASRWSALASPSESLAAAGEGEPVGEDVAGDGIELSAARVVEAIDAPAPDDEAVGSDAAEALQGHGSSGFAGVDDAPSASSRTPIVFPDEVAEVTPPTSAAVPDDGWPQAPVAAEATEAAMPSWLDERATPAANDGASFAEALDAGAPPVADADAERAIPAEAPAAEATPPADEAPADTLADALGLGSEVFVLADTTEDAALLAASNDADAADVAAAEADAAPEVEAVASASLAEPAAVPTPDIEPAPVAAAEQSVAIPRPEATAASNIDEDLLREAIELVTATRRANTVFLQRKLRVDYDVAAAVLAELAARGVVALDAEATHGRVLV